MSDITAAEFRTAEKVARSLGFVTAQSYADHAARLESEGTVPDGGMALTAEDVRKFIIAIERHYPEGEAELLARLRTLFPATEPAAVRDGSDLVVVERSHTAKAVQSWMTLDLWTDLGKNDNDFDAEYERQGLGDLWAILLGEVRALVQATTPAPAEPAEEETETEEGAIAMQRRFIAEIRSMNPDAVMSKRLDDLEAELNASSPVVPAATEPVYVNVPTWQEVPEGITYHPEGRPEGFVNRGGQPYYLGMSKPLSATFEQLEDFMRPQGPFYFVPAPTETGPWIHRVNGEICVASPASGLPYTIGKFNDHGDFVWHSSAAELPEGFAPFVAAEEG